MFIMCFFCYLSMTMFGTFCIICLVGHESGPGEKKYSSTLYDGKKWSFAVFGVLARLGQLEREKRERERGELYWVEPIMGGVTQFFGYTGSPPKKEPKSKQTLVPHSPPNPQKMNMIYGQMPISAAASSLLNLSSQKKFLVLCMRWPFRALALCKVAHEGLKRHLVVPLEKGSF